MSLQPKDLVGNPLLSSFGSIEFEGLAKAIIDYLANDNLLPCQGDKFAHLNWTTLHETGWRKPFSIYDLQLDLAKQMSMLVAFACAQWIDHIWFPKGVFRVSEGFVARLEENFGTQATLLTADPAVS